jgi:hypothetical protein
MEAVLLMRWSLAPGCAGLLRFENLEIWRIPGVTRPRARSRSVSDFRARPEPHEYRLQCALADQSGKRSGAAAGAFLGNGLGATPTSPGLPTALAGSRLTGVDGVLRRSSSATTAVMPTVSRLWHISRHEIDTGFFPAPKIGQLLLTRRVFIRRKP